MSYCIRLFFLIFFVIPAFSQHPATRFDRISLANGLSNNTVYCIFQDKKGFLWLGTLDGLNRYDGYEIKVFRHTHLNQNTLAGNRVTNIFEDKNGQFWLYDQFSTNISRFNPQKEQFQAYYLDKITSQDPGKIKDMYETPDTGLWVTTTTGLSFQFNTQRDNFSLLTNNPSFFNTADNLLKFNDLTKAFESYLETQQNHTNLAGVAVKKIIQDSFGKYWIATKYDGLYTAQKYGNSYRFYSHLHQHEGDVLKIPVEEINDVFEDKFRVIWVGTKNMGLFKFAPDKHKFFHLPEVKTAQGILPVGAARAVTEDNKGRLWIGTNENGLLRIDRTTWQAQHYISEPGNPTSLGHRYVRSLWNDPQGNIWVGHYGGFSRYNPSNNNFTRFLYQSRNLPDNTRVYDFKQAPDGTVWMAAWGLLLKYQPLTNDIQPVLTNSVMAKGLANDNIREIVLDKAGNLWMVATEKGLACFDTIQGKFVSFKFNPHESFSLPSSNVFHVFQDSKRRIWVATADGLAEFEPATGKFYSFTTREGLPGTLVFGILEDDKGFLWLSTTNGLTRFNPETKKYHNYDISDGLQSNEFLENAFYKTSGGEMIFGGVNGINIFRPEEITDNPVPPEVVITQLKLFNKPVFIGEKTGYNQFLDKEITFQEELVLSPEQRFFTLAFAALHTVNPEKNKYAYKLEGFDEDWIYRDAQVRFASYTNLQPGTYFFHVKACNSDGIWNESGVTLKIIIQPPFYDTWWFLSVCGSILVALAFWIYRRRINLIKKQESLKAIQLESELNFLKSQVNPHFLFNTLNNIYALCQFNSQDAAPMVSKLSDMMRYMIYDCNADRVFLSKEIEYLRNYMDLHRLKSDKELNIRFLVEGAVENAKIVPLLLINFLENSFKHGDIHFNREGHIFIKIQVSGNELTFFITNSFRDKVSLAASKKGIGLENVKQRLNLLYTDRHSLKIAKNDTIFEVELKLLLD